MASLPAAGTWLPIDVLVRLILALGTGLLVGLEREWRGKEAGLRTFGLASVLGALAGLLGTEYAIVSMSLLGILIVFLNLQSMRSDQGTELTTSAALLLVFLTGVLCGLGHRVTPVAVSVVTAGLLSWKERLAQFGHNLTAAELRSAILLGILAFAVYPVLPDHAVDSWGLIVPRDAWLTVLLIAGIGFANYILWKLFGTRGIEFAGFLGGLVNSTVTVTELSSRVAVVGSGLVGVAYRGILFSTAAMALRNAVVLGLLERRALVVAGASLGLMLVVSAVLGLLRRRLIAILLCVAVGVGAGALTVRQAKPVYKSESTVLLSLSSAQTAAEALQGLQISSQLLLSYAATFTTQVSQEKTTFEAVCLGNVFTYPGARHRGYARQVVHAATLAIRSSGADVAALLCSPELTPFYATSGWVPTPESATVAVDAEVVDAVRMMLFLSPRGRGARSRLESLPLHVPFPW